MKRLLITIATSLILSNSYSFEILAIGTSNTNCRAGGHAFTSTVEAVLVANSINATVLNAGVDGDKPTFMLTRLESLLKANPSVKLVIFEPGPNEKRKNINVESLEKVLAYLQSIKMPTIYASTDYAHTRAEGQAASDKFGAYYYGPWYQGVPRDKEHYTFDNVNNYTNNFTGHMNAGGCARWGKNIAPLVQKVIEEKNIR